MRCLLIADSPFAELGLTALIRDCLPNWRIASTRSVEIAIEWLDDHQGSSRKVILIEAGVGNGEVVGFIARLAIDPPPGVMQTIVLADQMDHSEQYRFTPGSPRYLPRNGSMTQLREMLLKLDSFTESLVPDTVRIGHVESGRRVSLTPRQEDLVRLLLAGYSNKRIAYELGLSVGTVKNYMFDLMRLVSVRSRFELAMLLSSRGQAPQADTTKPDSKAY